MRPEILAVDLFCGAGGLTLGLQKSGIQVILGVDLDGHCEFPYTHNTGVSFIKKDIREFSGHQVFPKRENKYIKLLAGCAPCQPFSKYRNGQEVKDDYKWGLLYEFLRVIKESDPHIITMENVPEVKNHAVFHDFIKELSEMDYVVNYAVLNSADYGVPQFRKRLVLFASRIGNVEIPLATHNPEGYLTVKDAIFDLPPIEAGEVSKEINLHKSAKMSTMNLRRIKQSLPGGTWKDWDSDLVAKCHRKESGKQYHNVYGRMEWSEPAPTITTMCFGFGNGRFGHPEQNRGISLLEAALLQTFPKDFQFTPENKNLHIKHVARMIGNAVPVRLGEAIGKSIVKSLY